MARSLSKQRQPVNAASSGQIAAASSRPWKTKEMQPRRVPHLRQDEIDALPTPVSMPWDGKGVFWRQGAAEFFGGK